METVGVDDGLDCLALVAAAVHVAELFLAYAGFQQLGLKGIALSFRYRPGLGSGMGMPR